MRRAVEAAGELTASFELDHWVAVVEPSFFRAHCIPLGVLIYSLV